LKSVAPLGEDALSVLATHELLDAEIIGYQKKRVAELSESEPERKKMVKARCYCSKTLVTSAQSLSHILVFSAAGPSAADQTWQF
jgi:hypothetical protein